MVYGQRAVTTKFPEIRELFTDVVSIRAEID